MGVLPFADLTTADASVGVEAIARVVDAELSALDLLDDDDVAALGARGYVVKDNAFDRAACLAALEAARGLRHDDVLTPAGVSRDGVNAPRIRSDHTTFLDESDLPAGFVDIVAGLTRLQENLRTRAWLSLPRRELQLACYPGGGVGYARHLDSFAHPVAAGQAAPGLLTHRKMTAIVYLNPDWGDDDGGALRIWPDDGAAPIDVAPLLGRLVVFQSERIEHAVLPTTRPRFALTMWLSSAA